MPSPEELYGSPAATNPAASSSAPATTATGGQQEYIPPVDVYGQPVQHPDVIGKAWEQVKEDLPAVGGATVAAPVFGEAGVALGAPLGPPGMVVGGFLGSSLGAAIGGAGGKGYQVAYREITGDPKAPDNSYDAAVQISKAGGEQAAWEMGGQIGGRVIGKGFNYIRPKAVEGIAKLNVAIQNAGGRLSAAQQSDSWALHMLDSLTRGSMSSSGVMKTHDVINEQAIKNLEAFTRQNIAKNVTDNLSGGELGNLFMNTVNGGKDGFKTAVGNLYEGLDTLVPHSVNVVPVVNRAPVGALVPPGPKAAAPITSPTGVDYIAQRVEPVDMSSLKASATKLQNDLQAQGFAGESSESRNLLNSILAADDRLSFSNAQSLRSNLLDAQRNLEGNVGKSKISGKINNFADLITQSMDSAAQDQGASVLKKYLAIKDYANKGYQAFNDRFVNDLLSAGQDNAANIGKTLFKIGNEQEIQNAKRALRYSSKFTKDPNLTYDQVWPKMQAGYLDDILNRNSSFKGTNIPATATQENIGQLMMPQGKNLLDEFTDPAKARTLKQVFTKEQRDGIFTFAQVAERVQRAPQGGLGMVAKLGQGGVVLQALGGALTATHAAVTFIPSYVMARMLTNPYTASILAKSLETPVKNNAKALPLLNRVAMEAYKANQISIGQQ